MNPARLYTDSSLADPGGQFVPPSMLRNFSARSGSSHILTVVVEFFTDRAVQVVQLLLWIICPGRTLDITLPATQLVVDLIIANGRLGWMQLLDPDLKNVACLGVQVGRIACWFCFRLLGKRRGDDRCVRICDCR